MVSKRLIVIKVGTNLLTSADGKLNTGRIGLLSREIVGLQRSGRQVILVTSGAIGAGMGKMGLKQRPTMLKDRQALAAIGQPLLMELYQGAFKKLKGTIAQVLLTRHDFEDRQRFGNIRNTLKTLLDQGVVPIINENDTVAVEEIGANFGDNDTLAAVVAAAMGAGFCFLLTDVDGLYSGIPGKSPLIPIVKKITSDIERCAGPACLSGRGTGGMVTKLKAAKTATSAGVTMVIVNGGVPGVVTKVLAGKQHGTTFLP
jgi:glutamate 5-kinase